MASETNRSNSSKGKLATGEGRVLVSVYAVFALAALGRGSYELATKFLDAPIAYSFSIIAAAIYIVAVVAIVRGSRKVAKITIYTEFALVLVIGLLSLIDPAGFEGKSLWSQFGLHYGLVPLLLPIWGIWWLKRA